MATTATPVSPVAEEAPHHADDVARACIPPRLEALVRALKVQFDAASLQPTANGALQLPSVDVFAVRDLLSAYASHARDNFEEWKKYAHFSEVHYTRNLVYSCDDFELIALCWGPGHASRIHNHEHSHCWLSVLSGVVSEQLYQPAFVQGDATLSLQSEAEHPSAGGAECPMLLLLREAIRKEGDVGYINDALSLHRVANCRVSSRDDAGAPPALTPGSVTLHLYAPPIRRVKIFEPGEHKVYERTPGYFSVHGVRK